MSSFVILPYPSDSCLLLRCLRHLHPRCDLLISDRHFRREERLALHEVDLGSDQTVNDGEKRLLEVVVALGRDVVEDNSILSNRSRNLNDFHLSFHTIHLASAEDDGDGGEPGTNYENVVVRLLERDTRSHIEHDNGCVVIISLDSSVDDTGTRVIVNVEDNLSHRRRELKRGSLNFLGFDVSLLELTSEVSSEEHRLSGSASSNEQSLDCAGNEIRGNRSRKRGRSGSHG